MIIFFIVFLGFIELELIKNNDEINPNNEIINMDLTLKYEIKNKFAGFTITGFISGILHSSTTMSGPPVALFLASQGTKKEEFRANLTAYFFIFSIKYNHCSKYSMQI